MDSYDLTPPLFVHWDIPARQDVPPIGLSWFAGGGEAEKRRRDALRELLSKHPQWGNADDKRWSSWVGSLWIGTEGVMYTFGHGDTTVAISLDASDPTTRPRGAGPRFRLDRDASLLYTPCAGAVLTKGVR